MLKFLYLMKPLLILMRILSMRLSVASISVLKEKTVVIIAHRLSTVKDVDCIFFLEEGKITGSGTHKELLENHERYARFVQEQMIE